MIPPGGLSHTARFADTRGRSQSTFQVSTIGSVQSFLMVFLGLFSGPLFDRGHFRLLLRTGSALIGVGTILQGLCVEYWQLLLSQGVCIGLGMGCLAVPSLAVASSWFSSKLPLANGIIVSASGFGGYVSFGTNKLCAERTY